MTASGAVVRESHRAYSAMAKACAYPRSVSTRTGQRTPLGRGPIGGAPPTLNVGSGADLWPCTTLNSELFLPHFMIRDSGHLCYRPAVSSPRSQPRLDSGGCVLFLRKSDFRWTLAEKYRNFPFWFGFSRFFKHNTAFCYCRIFVTLRFDASNVVRYFKM